MIETVAETGSTSTDLGQRLRGGDRIPEGHWLVADRQSAGRGRLGRDWTDGAGNFMGSTAVHLRAGDPPAPTLALVAGLAVHAVLAPLLPAGLRAELKWPNDVMIAGAKLAGVLLEREGDSVVIGVGTNLAAAPTLADRPTVALADLAPQPPSRDAFAGDLAAAFTRELDRWRSYGLGPIIARWQAAAHAQGTPLVVADAPDGPIAGAFAGLGEDGSLQLRLADGDLRAIHAGDVRYA